MPVAKLYTGRCTQGKTVVMQRGEQNKWRTESASKWGRQTNNKTTTKMPQPPNQKPHIFLPSELFVYQIQVHVAKKKKKCDLGLFVAKKLKTVLSKWRRFSVYTCRWCTWGTVCKGLSNIFLFMWTGSLVMFKLLNFTIKSIWHSKLPQYI